MGAVDLHPENPVTKQYKNIKGLFFQQKCKKVLLQQLFLLRK